MATSNPTRLRLLIVDDDDQLRQTLARRFERQGMAVAEAANGEDALVKAAQTRCDVALLDLHLPDTTGIDLLGQLKERQPELEALDSAVREHLADPRTVSMGHLLFVVWGRKPR